MVEVLKYLASFVFVCVAVFILFVAAINTAEMVKIMSFTQFLVINIGMGLALVHPVKRMLFQDGK